MFERADWHPIRDASGAPWVSRFMSRHSGLLHVWSGQGQNLSSTRGHDAATSSLRRASLCVHLGVNPMQLGFCEQVHGTDILNVDQLPQSPSSEPALGKADGIITAQSQVPLLALSADCPILLIFASDVPALGLAHAGWRGTLGGMAESMVGALRREFGGQPESMWAIIGPSAGSCCYEVREDVTEPWRSRFGSEDGTLRNTIGAWTLDLQRANGLQLLHAGIPAQQIGLPYLCTICDSRFYSYRRMGASTGHSGLIAALKAC